MRVVVPARNEARSLPALLKSVDAAIAYARDRRAWCFEVVVAADHCDDDTAAIAVAHGATVVDVPNPGGKIEALRAGFDVDGSADVDVHVCIDADVVVGERTLHDLIAALLSTSTTLATCPPLTVPPSPSRPTPLAWALWRYNRSRGFSTERLWLSGRCYAIRHVDFPTVDEMRKRSKRLRLHRTMLMRADDIWLSRHLVQSGADAIVHVDTDPVVFRPPATLQGMSRTWRRLRRELHAVDTLFPELPSPGRDRAIVRQSLSRSDRLALAIFEAALRLCRWHAEWLSPRDDGWLVVRESKVP